MPFYLGAVSSRRTLCDPLQPSSEPQATPTARTTLARSIVSPPGARTHVAGNGRLTLAAARASATVSPMPPRPFLFLLVALVASACGGKTVPETGDGGGVPGPGGNSSGADASGGGDGAGSSDGSGIGRLDASPVFSCIQGPGSGGGSSSGCQVNQSETCSDGTTYQVSCSCPAATCTCTESSANSGSGGGGIPFSGCPSCSATNLWEVCGFPQ